MRTLLAALVAILACDSTGSDSAPASGARPGAPAAELDHEHALWTKVLARHVQGDRFDYAALKDDRGDLDAYLGRLEAVTPDELAGWTREQRFAFWIDAYNGYTVRLVVDHYPVDSIKDVGSLLQGPWKRRFVPLGHLAPEIGEAQLTLDEIEHAILRPTFEDPRVHAAVNCASVGCPPLRGEAFVAERLDLQLEEQTRAWLADPTRNRIERGSGTLRVSKVFDWFREDFGGSDEGVVRWIAEHVPDELAGWLREHAAELEVDHLDYSWKLNDAR